MAFDAFPRRNLNFNERLALRDVGPKSASTTRNIFDTLSAGAPFWTQDNLRSVEARYRNQNSPIADFLWPQLNRQLGLNTAAINNYVWTGATDPQGQNQFEQFVSGGPQQSQINGQRTPQTGLGREEERGFNQSGGGGSGGSPNLVQQQSRVLDEQRKPPKIVGQNSKLLKFLRELHRRTSLRNPNEQDTKNVKFT